MNRGVLLVNLGSPNSTQVRDVRRYLREFLMDSRVIDIPYLLRVLLLEAIVLPRRPKKTSAAYRSIWWREGSPLIVISKRIQQKLQHRFEVPIVLAMRYGNPSIRNGIEELKRRGVDEFLLIPMYPQYAMATYETVTVKVKEELQRVGAGMRVDAFPPFYARLDYIEVLAKSIRPYLSPDKHVLFSYHGVPERHIYKSDPTRVCCKIDDNCCQRDAPSHAFCYRHQCYKSTQLVAQRLNLPTQNYTVAFQSRFGKDPWIKPFTDETLEELPKKGIKDLVVVCSAFTADCLETLEEIGMEGKEQFLGACGKSYTLVPCLNDSEDWIRVLQKWIDQWIKK